jgi:cytochrome P450
MRLEIEQLGASGRFEVFAEMRRLGHRLGLASWIGNEAATERHLNRLIPLFDRLDSASAFVSPANAFVIAATRYARERRAMHAIEATVAEIWAARQRRGARAGDFLEQIYASYDDLEPAARDVGVARDVIMLHLGAQSNLYAALAWTFINVVQRPEVADRVRAGDGPLALVSAGNMLPHALDAWNALAKEGVRADLVSVCAWSDLADEDLAFMARHGLVVSVEDHNPKTGLGTLLQARFNDLGLPARVVKLGVTGYASSGPAKDLYRLMGLDGSGIAAAVRAALAGKR